MKRIKAFILGALFMAVCAPAVAGNGIQEGKAKVPGNIIKLSYGPAVLTSNIYYGNDVYGNLSAMNLEVEYTHVWSNGWGLGVQGLQSHFDVGEHSDCMNLFYVGPCVSYNYRTTKDWLWHLSVGVGYASWDDVPESHSGVGSTTKLGVDYMLSRHIGIGVESTSVLSWFKKPKGWSEHHHDEGYGISQYGFSLGVRFYL